MEYRKLGSSELEVSRICLGCMGFGDAQSGQHSWTVDEKQTRSIVQEALAAGINFFDTALAYQNKCSHCRCDKLCADPHDDKSAGSTAFGM